MTVRVREGGIDDSSRVMAKRVSSLESDHVKEGARGVQKADQSKRIQNTPRPTKRKAAMDRIWRCCANPDVAGSRWTHGRIRCRPLIPFYRVARNIFSHNTVSIESFNALSALLSLVSATGVVTGPPLTKEVPRSSPRLPQRCMRTHWDRDSSHPCSPRAGTREFHGSDDHRHTRGRTRS